MKRKRNTQAFTFLAWTAFVLSLLAEYIGIWYLEEALSVKGYYAVTGAFLVMASIVLQKTLRDNQEDEDANPQSGPIS